VEHAQDHTFDLTAGDSLLDFTVGGGEGEGAAGQDGSSLLELTADATAAPAAPAEAAAHDDDTLFDVSSTHAEDDFGDSMALWDTPAKPAALPPRITAAAAAATAAAAAAPAAAHIAVSDAAAVSAHEQQHPRTPPSKRAASPASKQSSSTSRRKLDFLHDSPPASPETAHASLSDMASQQPAQKQAAAAASDPAATRSSLPSLGAPANKPHMQPEQKPRAVMLHMSPMRGDEQSSYGEDSYDQQFDNMSAELEPPAVPAQEAPAAASAAVVASAATRDERASSFDAPPFGRSPGQRDATLDPADEFVPVGGSKESSAQRSVSKQQATASQSQSQAKPAASAATTAATAAASHRTQHQRQQIVPSDEADEDMELDISNLPTSDAHQRLHEHQSQQSQRQQQPKPQAGHDEPVHEDDDYADEEQAAAAAEEVEEEIQEEEPPAEEEEEDAEAAAEEAEERARVEAAAQSFALQRTREAEAAAEARVAAALLARVEQGASFTKWSTGVFGAAKANSRFFRVDAQNDKLLYAADAAAMDKDVKVKSVSLSHLRELRLGVKSGKALSKASLDAADASRAFVLVAENLKLIELQASDVNTRDAWVAYLAQFTPAKRAFKP